MIPCESLYTVYKEHWFHLIKPNGKGSNASHLTVKWIFVLSVHKSKETLGCKFTLISVKIDVSSTSIYLLRIGGSGAPPPRVQILSFWHTNFKKRSRLGSWHPPPPPTRLAPPYGKSWICHCFDLLINIMCSGGSRISHGGHQPHRGRQLPRQLRFEKFVCQNERIWTLRGRAPAAPPGSANDVYQNFQI